MASFRLITVAAEIFRRPVRLATLSLGFAGMLALTASPAAAQHQFPQGGKQQWTAPTVPSDGGVEGAITDGEPAVPADGEPVVPDAGSEVPDVADLGGDAGFASAGQSAAPNVIGDTVSFGSCGVLFAGTSEIPVCFNGGRKFKATVNQSAIPQDRVFYSLNFHDSAFLADNGTDLVDVDLTSHVFGYERILDCCGCSSIQIQVPYLDTITHDADVTDSDLDGGRFGNVSVAYKRIISQQCCQTWTAGLALDIPTGEDTTLTSMGNVLEFENEAFTLSPFLAFLDNSGGCLGGDWTQGFISVDIPLNSHDVLLNGVHEAEVDELTVLNIDLAIGKWLHQDCCGNGVAGIVELHYQTALDDDEEVAIGAATFIIDEMDVVNLTLGAQIVNGCWTITPAYVTPISDDELFDWEFALHVNRRF